MGGVAGFECCSEFGLFEWVRGDSDGDEGGSGDDS